jgi:branched-chain amino acid transport system ATP-binding protein
MLEISGLDVAYGDMQAVHGLTLEIRDKEIVAVVGSNGAGKTTTLKTISGLLRPRRGSIRFDGRPLEHLPAHVITRAGIAHVPEGRRLFPLMTVRENIVLGACTPAAKAALEDTVEFIFALFPRLKDRQAQLAGTLSGGEQQMCAIARGLALRPRLLMLDEPSLGLAPNIVQSIFGTIRDVNARGVTVLLVEQNVKQALALAHRAYVLENGAILLTGDAASVAENDHVRRAYLGI